LLFSSAIDDGVGEDEIHGKNATRRKQIMIVMTNCEKKECELVETVGNIRNKIELIDDDALFDIFWIYVKRK